MAPAALTLTMMPATLSLDILVSPNAWMLKAPMRKVAVAGHGRATVSRNSTTAMVAILPGGMLSRRDAVMAAELGKLLWIWGQSKKTHVGPS